MTVFYQRKPLTDNYPRIYVSGITHFYYIFLVLQKNFDIVLFYIYLPTCNLFLNSNQQKTESQ